MSAPPVILCDGCGQPASPEHTGRRLQRLEWATRYRPIHLHTLLLGAASPKTQSEFLYSPDEVPSGEAAHLFSAADILAPNNTPDASHSEFQRRGLFLTHILECPLDAQAGGAQFVVSALTARLPAIFTRIRRSLRPKRLAFISSALDPFIDQFACAQLGCELVLDDGRPFALNHPIPASSGTIARLQGVLALPASR
jgi:hypothetical protein